MTEAKITKDMTIGDIVAKYPQVTEVLMGYGLHCVGCHVNGMESLAQGAMSHGLTEEEIDQIVKDANEAIENSKNVVDNRPLITVTQAAVNKVRELARKDNKEGWHLKVFVMPGGCSGFKYGMDFIEKPEENDIFVEQHGMKVYVDKDMAPQIKGCTIDYVDTLNDAGFKIENPNATRTCGCGSSFS